MRLKGKIAIVTGASSGIGLSIAETYLDEGAKVVFSDINEIDVDKHGDSAVFVKCDVTKAHEVEALVKTTVEKFGSLEIMVNNAGIGSMGSILDTDDEVWDKTIKTNLYGVFYGMRAASNYMKENGIKGSIINMSSILGNVGMAGAIAYCAAKGGVAQLTHAGTLDLAPYGIRVNAIAPGFIETNMTKDVLLNKEFNDMIVANTPLGHVGKAKDIANAALFLGSDESSYVAGEVLFVDGGWRAH